MYFTVERRPALNRECLWSPAWIGSDEAHRPTLAPGQPWPYFCPLWLTPCKSTKAKLRPPWPSKVEHFGWNHPTFPLSTQYINLGSACPGPGGPCPDMWVAWSERPIFCSQNKPTLSSVGLMARPQQLSKVELKGTWSWLCSWSLTAKLHSSYLPGAGVNCDHEGSSPRARPFHCTSVGLTPAITPNVGNSSASFLLVGDLRSR